ncbi:membrane-bound protein lytR [Mycobacterium tuberculosis]|nr:membrane-bound protein lytR [Mycobacterium tuberculosis]
MPPLTSLAPTTAERIRSACARAGGALLVVEREDPVPVPIHHLLSVRWCGSAAASTRSRPQSWLRPWT